jgi:hypothetical protein
MEEFILTAGQLMLALAAVASCMALVYVAVWLLVAIVRMVRRLGNPYRDRAAVIHRGGRLGGSARKW